MQRPWEYRGRRKERTYDTQLTIRLSKELRGDAESYCHWARVNISDVVRKALEDFVKEQTVLYQEEEASRRPQADPPLPSG